MEHIQLSDWSRGQRIPTWKHIDSYAELCNRQEP